MTELKETQLDEALNNNAESEGSIQSLFLNQEITLKSAQIRESTKKNEKTGLEETFKVTFMTVDDSTGKERVCNSSAIAIVDYCEKLLKKGLGKTIKVPVRCVSVVRTGKDDYLKLDKV